MTSVAFDVKLVFPVFFFLDNRLFYKVQQLSKCGCFRFVLNVHFRTEHALLHSDRAIFYNVYVINDLFSK